MESDTFLYFSGSSNPVILKDIMTLTSSHLGKKTRLLESVIIGNSVTSLDNNCFTNCIKLSKISINSSVNKLGNNCFSLCYSLKEVILNEGIKLLGDYCFKGCFNLTSIILPETLESIGNYCFQSCSKLANLEFKNPKNLKICGENIFENIQQTIYMTFNKTKDETELNESILILTEFNYKKPSLNSIFYKYNQVKIEELLMPLEISISKNKDESVSDTVNTIIYLNRKTNPTTIKLINIVIKSTDIPYIIRSLITRVSIGSSVNKLDNECFKDCINLTSVTFQGQVVELGSNCFTSCALLRTINLENVTGKIGESCFQDCNNLTNVKLNNSVTELPKSCFENCSNLINSSDTNFSNLNKLGERCFYACSRIIYIDLMGNISILPKECFAECINLTKVGVNETSGLQLVDDYCFYNCTNLKFFFSIGRNNSNSIVNVSSTTIPNSINKLGFGAFSSCTNLTDFNASNANITYVGQECFKDCSSLTNISFNNKLTVLGGYSYEVGNGCFRYCIALSQIILYDSITELGGSCFGNCTSITNITLPKNIDKLSDSLLTYCSSLTIFTIPDKVKVIGQGAFYACNNLSNIYIPASVTSIQTSCFTYCSKLSSITFQDARTITFCANNVFEKVTYYDPLGVNPTNTITMSFVGFESSSVITTDSQLYKLTQQNPGNPSLTSEYYIYEKVKTTFYYNGGTISTPSINIRRSEFTTLQITLFSSVTNVFIPEGVVSIDNSFFEDCSQLKEIIIPSTITSLGLSCFKNCSDLTNIIFTSPCNITELKESCFKGCSKLSSLTIPASIIKIGNNCFEGCSSLSLIKFNDPLTLINIGTQMFKSITNPITMTFDTLSSKDDIPDSSALYTLTQQNPENPLLDSKYYIYSFPFTKLYYSGGSIKIQDINLTRSNFSQNDIALFSSVTRVVIYSNVVSIDNSFFEDCTQLKKIIIPSTITSLGLSCFKNCSDLTNILFITPCNIKELKDSCFEGCSNLSSLTIPASISSLGNKCFESCLKLINIKFNDPLKLTNVGTEVFKSITNPITMTFDTLSSKNNIPVNSGLYNLTQQNPSNPKLDSSYYIYLTIENTVFKVLGNQIINKNISVLNRNIFTPEEQAKLEYVYEVIIGKGVISIDNSFFDGFSSLRTITISSSVTRIGLSCFNYCYLLSNILFESPCNITELKDSCFEGCFNLSSLTIPASISSLGNKCFESCLKLINIKFNDPLKLTNVGTEVFKSITNPITMTFDTLSSKDDIPVNSGLYNLTQQNPENPLLDSKYYIYAKSTDITNFSQYYLNDGTIIYDDSISINYNSNNRVASSLTGLFIGNTATSIANNCFRNCINLSSIYIPPTIKSMENNCFEGCTNLKDINMISIVDETIITSIGNNCFKNCISLSKLIIPDSVITLGSDCFNGCTKLSTVRLSNKITSLSNNLFKNCSNLLELTIYQTVSNIDSECFNGCTSLKRIVFNNILNISTVGNNIFLNVVNPIIFIFLGNATEQELNMQITNNTNVGNLLMQNPHPYDTSLTYKPTIPSAYFTFPSILYLNDETNVYLSDLNLSSLIIKPYISKLLKITIGGAVINVFDNCFSGCSLLKEIVYSNNITKISKNCFLNCTSLTSININSGVIELGDNCFQGCKNLQNIIFTNPKILSICGNNIFKDIENSITITLNELSGPEDIKDFTNRFQIATGRDPVPIITKVFNNNPKNPPLNSRFYIYNTTKFYYSDGTTNKLNELTSINQYNIPGNKNSLVKVVLSSSITKINSECFKECVSLTQVDLTSNVVYIGNNSFESCDSLVSFKVSSNVTYLGEYCFKKCIGLSNILIDSRKTETILKGCFYGCSSLSTFTVPSLVVGIGEDCFYNCTNLTSINFTNKSSVRIIGNNAFKECKQLSEIILIKSIQEIGDNVFDGCDKLSLIDMINPNNLTKCGINNFINLTNSIKIILRGLADKTEIKNSSALRTFLLQVPNTITLNEDWIIYPVNKFVYNEIITITDTPSAQDSDPITTEIITVDNLVKTKITTTTTVKNNTTTISKLTTKFTSETDISFIPPPFNEIKSISINKYATKLANNLFKDRTTLNELNIPSNILEIGSYCFNNCPKIISLDISYVNIIGINCFEKCINLKYIYLSDNLKEIPDYCFSKCYNLETIIIPKSVSKIGKFAFELCGSLEYIIFNNPSNIKSVGENVFDKLLEPITFVFNGLTSNDINNITATSSLYSGLYKLMIQNPKNPVFSSEIYKPYPRFSTFTFNDGTSVMSNDEYILSNFPTNKEKSTLIRVEIGGLIRQIGISDGTSIFRNSSVTEVTLPYSINKISRNAFDSCSLLTKINIYNPTYLETIENDLFKNATTIITINFYGIQPNDVTDSTTLTNLINQVPTNNNVFRHIYTNNVSKFYFNNGKNKKTSDPNIGQSIAKESNAILIKAIISNSVTIIGSEIFKNCLFKSIYIPPSVNTIQGQLFTECNELKYAYLLFPINAQFSLFNNCNNLERILFNENITKLPNYAFKDSSSLTKIETLKSDLNIINGMPNIDEIGEYAFYNCISLENVPDFPNLTYFGNNCFYKCYAIKSFVMPAKLLKFQSNLFRESLLNYITCNNTIQEYGSIKESLFENLEFLIGINLSSTINKLGIRTFYNCKSLTSITVPDTVSILDSECFYGCLNLKSITIGSNVSYLGPRCFKNCALLFPTGQLNIPSSVKIIEEECFEYCISLISINFGINNLSNLTNNSNIKKLGNRCFIDCQKLVSVILPSNLTIIGESCFKNCYNLQYIIFPTTLVEMGDNCFENCNSITSISLPDNLNQIGKECFLKCINITSITIGTNTTLISEKSFKNLSKLNSISFNGTKLQLFDKELFMNCKSLLSINIPLSITRIEDKCFYGCRELTSITIPKNVTYLGKQIFNYCYALNDIIISDWYNIKFISNDFDLFNSAYIYEDENNVLYPVYPNNQTILKPINFTIYVMFDYAEIYNNSRIENSIYSVFLDMLSKNPISKLINPVNLPNGSTVIYDNISLIDNYTTLYYYTLDSNDIDYKNKYFKDILNDSTIFSNNYFTITNAKVLRTLNSIYNFTAKFELRAVTLGSNVISINNSAFENSSIKAISYPVGCRITIIPEKCFKASYLEYITLPLSVSEIGKSCFENCYNLKTVKLQNTSVTALLENTFRNCTALFNIEFPPNLQYIEDNCFEGCNSLRNVTNLPTTLKYISTSAFKSCISITDFTVPEGVEWIGPSCFKECRSLINIVLPSTLIYMFEFSLARTLINTIQIPDNVKFIGFGCFSNCNSLTNVIFPSYVSFIYPACFYGCNNLSSIVLPTSDYSSIKIEDTYYETFIIDMIELETPLFRIDTKFDGTVFPGVDGTGPSSYIQSESDANPYPKIGPFPVTSGNVNNERITGNILHFIFDKTIFNNLTNAYNDSEINRISNQYYLPLKTINPPLILPSRFSYNLDLTNLNGISYSERVGYTSSPKAKIRMLTRPEFDEYTPYNKYTTKTIYTALNRNMFYNCGNLKTITIPNCFQTIDSECFRLSGIENVNISDNIWKIKRAAFLNCIKLQEFTLGQSLSSKIFILESNLFFNCNLLSRFNIHRPHKGLYGGFCGINIFKNVPTFNLILYNIISLSDIVSPPMRALIQQMPNETKLPTNISFIYSVDQFTYINYEEGYEQFRTPDTEINIYLDSLTMEPQRPMDKIISVNFNFNGLTKLEDKCFFECKKLKYLYIIDSVTYVGDYCFKNCYEISEISLGFTDASFFKTNQSNVNTSKSLFADTKESNINYIGKECFKNCSSLLEVKLPKTITKLYISTFENCTSLRTVINLDINIIDIEERCFMNSGIVNINIPTSISILKEYLFNNCSLLETIVLPDSVTYIGDYCFQNCINLININFPDNLQHIGDYCFQNCSSLLNVILPKSIKYLGKSCFEGCINLIQSSIGNITGFIGESIFKDCTSLFIVELECNISSYMFENCSSLSKVDINGKYTTINSQAFKGCECLFSIDLLNVVNLGELAFSDSGIESLMITQNSIPSSCFKNCLNLEKVFFSSHTTSIGNDCFRNCVNLLSVNLPTFLHSIGDSAFYGCINLNDVLLYDNLVISLDSLKNIEKIILYINNAYNLIINVCEIINISIEKSLNPSLDSLINDYVNILNNISIEINNLNLIQTIIDIPKSNISSLIEKINNIKSLNEYNINQTLTQNNIIDSSMTIFYKFSKMFYNLKEFIKMFITFLEIFNKHVTHPNFESETTVIMFSSIVKEMHDNSFKMDINFKNIISNLLFSQSFNVYQNIINEIKTNFASFIDTIYNFKQIGCGTYLQEISTSCFHDCTSMQNIVIPESIVKLNDNSFRNCNLNTILIHKRINYIGNYCFAIENPLNAECHNKILFEEIGNIDYMGTDPFIITITSNTSKTDSINTKDIEFNVNSMRDASLTDDLNSAIIAITADYKTTILLPTVTEYNALTTSSKSMLNRCFPNKDKQSYSYGNDIQILKTNLEDIFSTIITQQNAINSAAINSAVSSNSNDNSNKLAIIESSKSLIQSKIDIINKNLSILFTSFKDDINNKFDINNIPITSDTVTTNISLKNYMGELDEKWTLIYNKIKELHKLLVDYREFKVINNNVVVSIDRDYENLKTKKKELIKVVEEVLYLSRINSAYSGAVFTLIKQISLTREEAELDEATDIGIEVGTIVFEVILIALAFIAFPLGAIAAVMIKGVVDAIFILLLAVARDKLEDKYKEFFENLSFINNAFDKLDEDSKINMESLFSGAFNFAKEIYDNNDRNDIQNFITKLKDLYETINLTFLSNINNCTLIKINYSKFKYYSLLKENLYAVILLAEYSKKYVSETNDINKDFYKNKINEINNNTLKYGKISCENMLCEYSILELSSVKLYIKLSTLADTVITKLNELNTSKKKIIESINLSDINATAITSQNIYNESTELGTTLTTTYNRIKQQIRNAITDAVVNAVLGLAFVVLGPVFNTLIQSAKPILGAAVRVAVSTTSKVLVYSTRTLFAVSLKVATNVSGRVTSFLIKTAAGRAFLQALSAAKSLAIRTLTNISEGITSIFTQAYQSIKTKQTELLDYLRKTNNTSLPKNELDATQDAIYIQNIIQKTNQKYTTVDFPTIELFIRDKNTKAFRTLIGNLNTMSLSANNDLKLFNMLKEIVDSPLLAKSSSELVENANKNKIGLSLIDYALSEKGSVKFLNGELPFYTKALVQFAESPVFKRSSAILEKSSKFLSEKGNIAIQKSGFKNVYDTLNKYIILPAYEQFITVTKTRESFSIFCQYIQFEAEKFIIKSITKRVSAYFIKSEFLDKNIYKDSIEPIRDVLDLLVSLTEDDNSTKSYVNVHWHSEGKRYVISENNNNTDINNYLNILTNINNQYINMTSIKYDASTDANNRSILYNIESDNLIMKDTLKIVESNSLINFVDATNNMFYNTYNYNYNLFKNSYNTIVNNNPCFDLILDIDNLIILFSDLIEQIKTDGSSTSIPETIDENNKKIIDKLINKNSIISSNLYDTNIIDPYKSETYKQKINTFSSSSKNYELKLSSHSSWYSDKTINYRKRILDIRDYPQNYVSNDEETQKLIYLISDAAKFGLVGLDYERLKTIIDYLDYSDKELNLIKDYYNNDKTKIQNFLAEFKDIKTKLIDICNLEKEWIINTNNDLKIPPTTTNNS